MTRLRERMIEDMRIRNLARNTQISYLQQVSLFARYFAKSPDVLGREKIRASQVYLTEEKKLSPRSITIAVSALRFLYKVTLRREWNLEEIIPAPKRPQKLPVILSPDEVLEFLGCIREATTVPSSPVAMPRGCGSLKPLLSRLATLTVDG